MRPCRVEAPQPGKLKGGFGEVWKYGGPNCLRFALRKWVEISDEGKNRAFKTPVFGNARFQTPWVFLKPFWGKIWGVKNVGVLKGSFAFCGCPADRFVAGPAQGGNSGRPKFEKKGGFFPKNFAGRFESFPGWPAPPKSPNFGPYFPPNQF